MLHPVFLPLLAFAAQSPEPQALFVNEPGRHEFSGRMIARPVQDDPAARAAARAEVESWVLIEYPEVDELILSVPAGLDENSFSAQLLASGAWEYVHPDWICYPLGAPNDPNYGNQWHHATIDSAGGWDLIHDATGRIASWTDTGVDLNHPDLAASLIPGYNAVDKLTQAAGGNLQDINGHGTLTGGTIGAIGNNGIGVAGACWDVSLMPVRVSNDPGGGAYLSDLTDGARWAVENGAKTISASYTGVQDPSIQTTGAYVRSMGGLYFYAADNYGSNHSGFDWADVVVVGATDQSDNLAWFSSYGLAVDLVAPGVDIWTTSLGGGYAGYSGTSLSTPLANGVAALAWAANPFLSSYELENRLYEGCDDLGAPGNDNTFGWGRVNLNKTVHAAVEGDMDLTVSTLMGGSSGSFSVSGAPASTMVYVAYSLSGQGLYPVPPLNAVLGLASPVEVGHSASNGFGNATVVKNVPGGASGLTVSFQAIAQGSTSDVEVVTIL
ncbi:MAG: S8 family serine peptidase [Planctomycetes bacterium]|nr:S8 family serine peptidase [Planctomycetota bacterium]MBL7008861.1 S8 family serine peptidase [Planctomycetota bacterium]